MLQFFNFISWRLRGLSKVKGTESESIMTYIEENHISIHALAKYDFSTFRADAFIQPTKFLSIWLQKQNYCFEKQVIVSYRRQTVFRISL